MAGFPDLTSPSILDHFELEILPSRGSLFLTFLGVLPGRQENTPDSLPLCPFKPGEDLELYAGIRNVDVPRANVSLIRRLDARTVNFKSSPFVLVQAERKKVFGARLCQFVRGIALISEYEFA